MTGFTKEECMNLARLEGDSEIGAGPVARDPTFGEPETFWPCQSIMGGCWDRSTCAGCETHFEPQNADIEEASGLWRAQKDHEPDGGDAEYFRRSWQALPGLRHFVELVIARRIIDL